TASTTGSASFSAAVISRPMRSKVAATCSADISCRARRRTRTASDRRPLLTELALQLEPRPLAQRLEHLDGRTPFARLVQRAPFGPLPAAEPHQAQLRRGARVALGRLE